MFRTALRSLIIVIQLFTAAALGQTATSTESAADKFRIGVDFLKAGKYESALEVFRAAARLDPKSPPTYGNIGFALMALKRPDEATSAFREAIRLAPSDASFHTALCLSL